MSMYPENESKANRQDVPYVHAEQANMSARFREMEREEAQRNEDGPFLTIAGEQEMRDWRVMQRFNRNLGPLASSMTLDRGDVIEKG